MDEFLVEEIVSLIEGEHDLIANLANISAALNDALDQINWVGFYLMKDGELVLGPFQGHPACVRLSLDKGVCAAAARSLQTVRVDDVHQFPGHIACDAASQSEMVIPLLKDDQCLGVLDIDAPIQGRFKETDQVLLEKLITRIMPKLFP